MSDTDDHVLPNGFTFLASTAGYYGSWAKATDPITAIRMAHRHKGGKKNPIYVVYGENEELYVDNMGGFRWDRKTPPTPIGLFTVTERSIKPMEAGDFGDEHPNCLAWMTDTLENIDNWLKASD